MTAEQSTRSAGSGPSLVTAIKVDLRTLHHVWMGMAFREHRREPHPVLGGWQPEGGLTRALYRLWALIGGPVVALLYPIVLAGFFIRYHVVRMDRFVKRVGLLGLVVTSLFAWTALTAAAYLRDFPIDGLLALVAAGGVATVSAVLAWVFSRIDGRPVSVLFAYPFGVTAVFLPPVVAALYSETLAAVVFARSDVLAIWLLDSVLTIGGLNALLRASFDLVGLAYVGMWFGLAIPVGWALGLAVAFADIIRPTSQDQPDAAAS